MIRILYDLEKYWDIERIPKHDLSKEKDDYFINIRTGNFICILIVFFIFAVTVCFVGGGMLS